MATFGLIIQIILFNMNKYLSYISDDHLLNCIKNLHRSYNQSKAEFTKTKFYSNKIDVIKLVCDSQFNSMEDDELIEVEILRQLDKSINNAIGTFHEEILGCIEGYEKGTMSGYDIKSSDNTLFADIKNKHNTMNSSASESLYQKLSRFSVDFPDSKCYWVQIWATSSFNTEWSGTINGKHYQQKNVYKISGDKFYELLTGEKDAFYQLNNSLPKAIQNYLDTIDSVDDIPNTALEEIKKSAKENNRDIIDQISFENFPYYSGFKDL